MFNLLQSEEGIKELHQFYYENEDFQSYKIGEFIRKDRYSLDFYKIESRKSKLVHYGLWPTWVTHLLLFI